MSREFVIVVSSDDYEFIFSKRIAELCPKFKQHMKIADMEKTDLNSPLTINIGIKAEFLEIVVQYLHYKNRLQSVKLDQLPKFYIQEDKALEVLKAAIELQL